MQYKTHLAVTYAAVLPALVSTGGISHSIGAVFGHRGLAHSILGIVFFHLISRWVLNYLQNYQA